MVNVNVVCSGLRSADGGQSATHLNLEVSYFVAPTDNSFNVQYSVTVSLPRASHPHAWKAAIFDAILANEALQGDRTVLQVMFPDFDIYQP